MTRILVEPTAYRLHNLGDVAMLVAALRRAHMAWPDARIEVLTRAPELLARYAPFAVPVPVDGRSRWTGWSALPEPVLRALPSSLRARVRRASSAVARRRPDIVRRSLGRRGTMAQRDAAEQYAAHIESADLVLIGGAGAFNDEFEHIALGLFTSLALADFSGVPSALASQGFGPLANPRLIRAASAVLPRVRLVGLREDLLGGPLLARLGVPTERIRVTGDDALEVAVDGVDPGISRQALGINVRLARYSNVSPSTSAGVGRAVAEVTALLDCPLQPLPVLRKVESSDEDVLADLVPSPAAPAHLSDDDPLGTLLSRVQQCRVVVTGSYHAAVFALAFGIPVIGLSANAYYDGKFAGLRRQFGGRGVTIVRPQDAPGVLPTAVSDAWRSSEEIGEAVRTRALEQVEQGRAFYRELAGLIGG